MILSLLALALALAATPTSAFWRLPCNLPVSVQRVDPIVSPNAVSGHVHTVMGGSGFDVSMDYAKARSSKCSTCTVKEDLSNYWTPNLWYQAQDGTFTPVNQVGGVLVYYLQRFSQDNNEKLKAFPQGFRMLAGDPFLRSYSDTPEQNAISFACIDYANPSPETPGMPTKNCNGGLRAQVFFPSCWDGVNLDSANHKSHMAYPDANNGGRCPSTHPVRTVSIFYEVTFDVDSWKDKWYNGKSPFVFSNGDPTGYGFHGDFLNGWDVSVLQNAITNCNAESGVIEECPYFTYFPAATVEDCMVAPRVDEPVTGTLSKLPGCNPVQTGPQKAVQQGNCGATTTVSEPKKYYSDVSSKGWEYVGCALDKLEARTFPTSFADNGMTIEKCIDYCVSGGYSYAGLEYASECFCGNSVASDRLGLMKCTMPCAGNANQYCGGPLKLTVYKKK